MYIVYVLKSKGDGKRYIGFTNNIVRRLFEHNNGLVKSTKNRRPLELIYSEELDNKSSVMEREEFLKSGKGREFLKNKNL